MTPIRPSGRVGAVMLLAFILPAAAATAHEPTPDGVPSFNESPGCDALNGIRGPLAAEPGLLELNEPIYGPWGDFYGRTVGLAWAQRVAFTYPSTSGSPKTFWVHQRVYPALQDLLGNLADEAAEGHTYTIRTGDSFSWARYTIPPTRVFSFHAVGAAVDINSTTNPYRADNTLITDMPAWFVDAWNAAGWCWGGDWVGIKDTMHYSWRGPLHSPGYVMPPPQPPLVAAASFGSAWSLDVRLGPPDPARRLFVIDIDRDGAPDVVAVTPIEDGLMAITAAPARNDFHWAEEWGVTIDAPVDPGAPALLGDMTADGRPDLVYVLPGPLDRITLEVHAHTGGEDLPRNSVATAVPYQSDAWFGLEDYDRDGLTDLFVVRPGTPASLEVWDGNDLTTPLIATTIDLASEAQLVLGDRDVDGVPDIYAMTNDGGLTIWDGADAYGSSVTVATSIAPAGKQLAAGDLDGDGHTDLFVVDGDGGAVMRRGGGSTHHPGVWYRLRTHQVDRIAGSNRYATAAAISAATNPDGADTVFVAVGDDFPDALAGSAVAGHLAAPLLLVARDYVPEATAAELQRLDPDTIVILGGTSVVAATVETQLGGYAPEVVRLGGADRYETAVAISAYGYPHRNSADAVVIATGLGYADALAGGPAAAALGGPLLLTTPGQLPPEVRDEIVRLDPDRILVLGGSAVVSNEVFAELQTLAPTERIAGTDRYRTAALLSAEVFPDGAAAIYLATGTGFPDGLAAGAAAGAQGIPILLVPPTSLPAAVRTEILRLGTYQVTLIGGETAISAGLAAAVETAGF